MKRVGSTSIDVDAEPDGRARRSARSRAKILDALSELISEGNLRPTGQQVAVRAGVGLRTVFRHFEDIDGLHREMSARIREIVRPLEEEPLPTGSVDERIVELVRRRAVAYERIAPYLRSDAINRWRSTFLSEAHAEALRELRAQLFETLPEAAALPGPEREAFDLLASFDAWNHLRVDQRLGRKRAEDTITAALRALLTSSVRGRS